MRIEKRADGAMDLVIEGAEIRLPSQLACLEPDDALAGIRAGCVALGHDPAGYVGPDVVREAIEIASNGEASLATLTDEPPPVEELTYDEEPVDDPLPGFADPEAPTDPEATVDPEG